MDNRGSKSINNSNNIIIVKEQRVDGSSVTYVTVRCILIAKKLVKI
jgi:hypothetical protein